jgi:GNAT superfamily N-acetyltransferase
MLFVRHIEYGSSDHQQMIRLRDELLRAPLGLTFSAGYIEQERTDILLGVFEDDGQTEEIAGCCILSTAAEGVIQLRQMAVQKERQRTGIGTLLMAYAEKEAREKGFHTVILHARKTAVPFYLRLGYEISGEEFEEVTLPHLEMRKQIS